MVLLSLLVEAESSPVAPVVLELQTLRPQSLDRDYRYVPALTASIVLLLAVSKCLRHRTTVC